MGEEIRERRIKVQTNEDSVFPFLNSYQKIFRMRGSCKTRVSLVKT